MGMSKSRALRESTPDPRKALDLLMPIPAYQQQIDNLQPKRCTRGETKASVHAMQNSPAPFSGGKAPTPWTEPYFSSGTGTNLLRFPQPAKQAPDFSSKTPPLPRRGTTLSQWVLVRRVVRRPHGEPESGLHARAIEAARGLNRRV